MSAETHDETARRALLNKHIKDHIRDIGARPEYEEDLLRFFERYVGVYSAGYANRWFI